VVTISPATSENLIERSLRPLTDAEIAWGAVRLDDAYLQIITAVPSVETRLATAWDSTLAALVVQVQCAMVLRVLANPDGVLEESGDDYTRRLDASISTGSLYLTDAERALLTVDAGGSEGAFSVRSQPASGVLFPDPWFPSVTTDTWQAW
jgi:hypothetical protein